MNNPARDAFYVEGNEPPFATTTAPFFMNETITVSAGAPFEPNPDGPTVMSLTIYNSSFNPTTQTTTVPGSLSYTFSTNMAAAIVYKIEPNGGNATWDVSCSPTSPTEGTLKICKVAGADVPIGTKYDFAVNNGALFSVPAGPAPGGFCTVAGHFPLDSLVAVNETVAPGISVRDIAVSPTGRLNSLLYNDVSFGSATVRVGSGVTEVTFTNDKVKKGYIEVCKNFAGRVPSSRLIFKFVVPGVGIVEVPAGYCSPSIQVSAGMVPVHELPTPRYVAVSCSAIPAPHTCAFNSMAQNATVDVSPGGRPTQTVVSFTNRRTRP